MTLEIQQESEDHPALRLTFGFVALNLVYFLYMLLFPLWIGLSDGIVAPVQGIVSATAPITPSDIYTLAVDISLAIGTCFLILFTGFAIFVGVSAVQKDTTGRYKAVAEAFMILTIAAIVIYTFSYPDQYVTSAMNSTIAPGALATPEFTAMTLVIQLSPAMMLFIALVYVIRHGGSGQLEPF